MKKLFSILLLFILLSNVRAFAFPFSHKKHTEKAPTAIEKTIEKVPETSTEITPKKSILSKTFDALNNSKNWVISKVKKDKKTPPKDVPQKSIIGKTFDLIKNTGKWVASKVQPKKVEDEELIDNEVKKGILGRTIDNIKNSKVWNYTASKLHKGKEKVTQNKVWEYSADKVNKGKKKATEIAHTVKESEAWKYSADKVEQGIEKGKDAAGKTIETVKKGPKEIKKEYKAHKKKQRIEAKQKRDEEVEKAQRLEEIKKMEEEEEFEFVKYNKNPGSNELDFFGIYGKRQINIKGVIAPDYSKLVYSEVHFYPSVKQVTSEIYLIKLSPFHRAKRRVLDAHVKNKTKINFYRSGMDKVEDGYFRTLTIIDWSKDCSKLLVKERLSENLRGFIDTKVWVYDFLTKKSYVVNNMKPKIIKYWKEKGLSLNKYRWDVEPLGWFKYQPERIVVNVYAYRKDKSKKFLGTWLAGYRDGSAVPLEGKKGDFPVEANGLILKKKSPYESL